MGPRTDLFVSAGNNKFQVRRELGCKLIRREFELEYAGKRFFVDRERGEISLAWKRLLRFTPDAVGPPKIEWNEPNLIAQGLSKSALAARIQHLF
eukprot:188312-Pyramimonas_sp.AAC.1